MLWSGGYSISFVVLSLLSLPITSIPAIGLASYSYAGLEEAEAEKVTTKSVLPSFLLALVGLAGWLVGFRLLC